MHRAVDRDRDRDIAQMRTREDGVQLLPFERRQHIVAEHEHGDQQLLQLGGPQRVEQRQGSRRGAWEDDSVNLQLLQIGVEVQGRFILCTW